MTTFASRVKANLPSDIPAGIVVFLVALPLCLGVALASGAPLISGIIAGVVGGIIVTLLSGSEISVSGPAAGLTVIVAGGILAHGSYEVFLCSVVLAGLLQTILATVRAGTLAALIPNTVINGMLAAIGIIIILKQIPHALGHDGDYEGDMSFFQITDHENTFTEILHAVLSFSPGVLTIAAVSMAILISWAKFGSKFPRIQTYIPASLIAVVSAVGLNELFKIFAPHLAVGESHLVQLPIVNSFDDAKALITFPRFDVEKLPVIATTAFVLAVVASIETLLCLEAADKIDPHRRTSNGNKELMAQGVGNMISGFFGGLPLTSVVVRTSANIYAGSRSRASSFVHGVLLLLSVAGFASILNLIPLSALAAILILVGYKLSSISLIKKMYAKGVDQFLPFIVTVLTIVFTDILTGVSAGLITSMFFVVKSNYHSAITMVNQGNHFLIRFAKDVSFINKVKLKKCFADIPDGSHLTINGSQALFIDKDILELIEDFSHNAKHRNIIVETTNLKTMRLSLFKNPFPTVEA